MATLSRTQVVQTGANLSATAGYAAAASGGDKFLPGDTTFVNVLNLSGGSITVTVDSPATCNQGGTHDIAIAIPTLSGRLIGPFPAARFAGTDGLVSLTYSSETSLWVRPQVI